MRFATIFTTKPGEDFLKRREALRVDEFQQAKFEMQTRIGMSAQIVVGGEEDVEEARQILFSELRGLIGQARAFIARRGNEIRIRAANAGDKQIAKMANRFAAEVLEILSVGDEAMDKAERAIGGLRGDGGNEIVEDTFGDDAQKLADLRVRDCFAAIGDGLLKKRKAIAKAAFSGAGEDGYGAGFDGKFFFIDDAVDFAGNFLKGESAELEKLGAGFDGFDEIFGTRGGENEDNAVRRLFQSFQERVRGFVGELVRFVEDDDFVAAGGGSVANHFAKLADLVNAAVGGSVNFDDIERVAGGNFAAGIAGAVRFGGGALNAIQRLGENERGGSLADAADTGKNVRVSDAVRIDGVGESSGDVLLADNFAESLRAIFSGDNFISHLGSTAFCGPA